MHQDVNDAIIVRSVVDLGHNLGLQIVAEGVEDDHTWDQLAQLGCDDAQGYFLARPMPPAALVPWLQATSHQVTITV
jgi:EAL domain-containing protein (putative c-di-GMP-specific phosphodiesterase class I)